MAHLDLVATLVDELDDVESILRLYDFRNLLGVGQVEGYACKSGVEHSASYVIHLTSLTSRARIFRVQTRQCGERSLALVDTVGIIAQVILYSIDFFLVDLRLTGDYLNLNFSRNEGDTVLGHVAEIVAHVRRCNRNVAHKLLLHLLYELIVAEVVVQLRTHLSNAHLLVFLKLLLRTGLLYPAIDLHVDVLGNFALGNLY